jgi:signal transduction histidine kinase
MSVTSTCRALLAAPVCQDYRSYTVNRVVIADDNPAMTTALSILLRRWGWDVVVTHDGPTAVAAIRDNRPELALIDIGLPRLDGLEVARCVRADKLACRLVAISGFDGPSDREQSSQAGFDTHLVKPVLPDKLRAAIGLAPERPASEMSGWALRAAGEPPAAPNGSPYEQFAAALAHDIRTPLALVLMYLAFIEEELGENVQGKLRKGLAGAREEIARLERLLESLVNYDRLGHLLVHPSLVDGGRVVVEAVQRELGGSLDARVIVDVGPIDMVDWWDSGALEQIVRGLLSNALRFGAGRPVSITVDRPDHDLRLRVEDHGSGIPTRTLAQLFDRRVPRELEPGLGLGLWLVHELAKAHGGSVTVETELGAGSTFIVILSPHRPFEAGVVSESPALA